MESIFGAPAVLLLGGQVIRLGRMTPSLLKAYRAKAILALALTLVCSLGVLGYVFVFFSDFYGILNCEGAGCAQASLGTFVFTPIAWLSSLLTWLVVRTVFSAKYFPHLSEQQDHRK